MREISEAEAWTELRRRMEVMRRIGDAMGFCQIFANVMEGNGKVEIEIWDGRSYKDPDDFDETCPDELLDVHIDFAMTATKEQDGRVTYTASHPRGAAHLPSAMIRNTIAEIIGFANAQCVEAMRVPSIVIGFNEDDAPFSLQIDTEFKTDQASFFKTCIPARILGHAADPE